MGTNGDEWVKFNPHSSPFIPIPNSSDMPCDICKPTADTQYSPGADGDPVAMKEAEGFLLFS